MREPKGGQSVTLQPGSRLGPYEVLSFLGAGGMGQVYRARDTRLARDVALKILASPADEDTGRFRRFQTEAKAAAAFSHPNIVAVHDIGREGGTAYLVSELVTGGTLTTLLERGPLPVKRMLDLAVPMAEALAAAHASGIVHRDLKPDNVLVAEDGTPKIADFGLAKYFQPPPEGSLGTTLSDDRTREGTIVGTVGYMSPEQAEGKAVDYRSDQFSFGSVLYEMATGRRAFRGKSAIDTLAAIINDEPEPIEKVNPRIPGPLRWIVERCHTKDLNRRYASTEDLARELTTLRMHLSDAIFSGVPSAVAPRRRLRLLGALTAGAVVGALAAVYFIGLQRGIEKAPMPTFHQLTFRRGSVQSARFTSDGRTVVYSASWDGAPERLFSTRIENPASAALALPDAALAAVSTSAELLLFPPRSQLSDFPPLTLSRAPLAGGAPRIVAEGVVDADWGPDGSAVALVRRFGGHTRLEYPVGRVLVENADAFSPRVSRDGKRVGYHLGPEGTSVAIVDLSGHAKILSSGWMFSGAFLQWSPKGDEIWFTASRGRGSAPLIAVSLSGGERVLLRLPGFIQLQDVSADGRVLLTYGRSRAEIRCRLPGWEGERDLSWFMSSRARDISADGKRVLFDELGDADATFSVYLRGTDGSPAQRLGEGTPISLSPDGGKVLAWDWRQKQYLVLSTGPGEPRHLLRPEADSGFKYVSEGPWFPDARRVLLVMREQGRDLRTYSLDVEAQQLEPLTPEGYNCSLLSPDGKSAFCDTPQGRRIYSFDRQQAREISGLEPDDTVRQWSSDSDVVFVVNRKEFRPQILRVDLATGHRQLWREFEPLEPAGLEYAGVVITPDGGSYCYTAVHGSNDLYVVEGLR